MFMNKSKCTVTVTSRIILEAFQASGRLPECLNFFFPMLQQFLILPLLSVSAYQALGEYCDADFYGHNNEISLFRCRRGTECSTHVWIASNQCIELRPKTVSRIQAQQLQAQFRGEANQVESEFRGEAKQAEKEFREEAKQE
jgi:hypothetical protein